MTFTLETNVLNRAQSARTDEALFINRIYLKGIRGVRDIGTI